MPDQASLCHCVCGWPTLRNAPDPTRPVQRGCDGNGIELPCSHMDMCDRQRVLRPACRARHQYICCQSLAGGALALLLPWWRVEQVLIPPWLTADASCSAAGSRFLEIDGPPCMQQVSPGVPRADGLMLHAELMCLSIKELHQGPAVGCRVLSATEQEAAVLGESQGCHCLQTGMVGSSHCSRRLLELLCTLESLVGGCCANSLSATTIEHCRASQCFRASQLNPSAHR